MSPARTVPGTHRRPGGRAVALATLLGTALLGSVLAAGPAAAQPPPPDYDGRPGSTVPAENIHTADPGSSQGAQPLSTAPSSATVVAQLTGTDATTDTAARWRVTGTDLGVMWDDGDGGVLTAFGDTFGEWPPGPAGGGGGEDWRSNVLLRSTDRDLSDGMSFDWALEDRPGHAGEIVPSLKDFVTETTTIPTAGIQVDGVQYLAYMSVRRWGEPGLWDTNYSRIAYSTDGGRTWNHTDGPTWENPGAETSDGDHPFQMVGFERHEGWVYMVGTPNGRAGAAHVARVPEAQILDKAAYEYWTGAQWERGAGADVRAAPVIEPQVSELSVRFDDHSGKWMISYLDSELDIVLRTADEPTGPWGPKQVITSFADYPAHYGNYFHPWSPDGELYLAISQWVPYNAYLVKISIDEDGNITAPNLVADGGFERQPVTDHDTAVPATAPWGCVGACRVPNQFEDAYAGSRHGLVTGVDGPAALRQQIAVEPNSTYATSVWVHASAAAAASVGVTAGDGTELAGAPVAETGAWTRVDLRFDTGPHTSIELHAGLDAGPDAWLRVDDASVVAVRDGDAAGPAFTATVAPRCVAGRLLLTVRMTSHTDQLMRMQVRTADGIRPLGVLRPGAEQSGIVNTRGRAVPAGTMTVIGTPPGGEPVRIEVPHGPMNC